VGRGVGDCPGRIIVGRGVGKGVRVAVGAGLGVGVSIGDGVAVGVGRGVGVSVGDGVGVGVGVRTFAFRLPPMFESRFASVLKLKFASIPRLVLTLRFSFVRFVLRLMFAIPLLLETNQKPMAPIASSAVVSSIVNISIRNVFAF